MRTQWRDCKAWIDDGLPMTTTNNECCKLYDAALTQVCGFYNDPSMGGVEKTIKDMLEADPEFVMGHVFVNTLKGDTGSTFDASEYRESIQGMLRLAEKQNITNREKKHVNAIKLLADGERLKAMDQWEDILLDHPTDQLALRNAVFTAGVALCNPERYRDMTSRALYAYTPSTPGYSNLLSWQAFGFEETKFYDKGEKIAKLSLEIEPREAWSSHTLAHVYEMQGRSIDGTDFMNDTIADWNSCDMLACHNHWHTALFKIDQGKFDEAIQIFDNEILRRAKASGTMFPLTDGASLLYRLEYEGVKTNGRWKELLDLSHKHIGHYNWIFQDAHLMMIACRGGGPEMAEQLLNGLKDFAQNCSGDSAVVAKRVGVSLCEAIKAYQDGEYDKATELLLSIKYDIYTVGGSDAQRDVFSQLLIHSALKSRTEEHVRLGRLLLAERRAKKESDCLTDRLMAQTLQHHAS